MHIYIGLSVVVFYGRLSTYLHKDCIKNILIEITDINGTHTVVKHVWLADTSVIRNNVIPSKHTTFVQHWYDIGSTSKTLGRHCINVVQMFVFAGLLRFFVGHWLFRLIFSVVIDVIIFPWSFIMLWGIYSGRFCDGLYIIVYAHFSVTT